MTSWNSALGAADAAAIAEPLSNHGEREPEERPLMIKCSFCEQPLVCKACGRPFRAQRGETHVGLYQPDMAVACPECQKLLVCRACGFAYGEDDDDKS